MVNPQKGVQGPPYWIHRSIYRGEWDASSW